MSLKNYHLLVGKPTECKLAHDAAAHIEVLLDVSGQPFRTAINVKSNAVPHTLIYRYLHSFSHPITKKLNSLQDGLYDLKSGPYSDLALDYVRDGMVNRSDFRLLTYRPEKPKNNFLFQLIKNAINAGTSRFFLFGASWGPEEEPDKYFCFRPGRGIHDIHMNQGSRGDFKKYNGTHQDGALFIQDQDGSWSAVFLAFTSQSWQTDDAGNSITPCLISLPQRQSYIPLRIIAALVNPYDAKEGKETVSIINLSDHPFSLNGWTLQDSAGRAECLSGYDIGAGDVARVRLTGRTMRLKNNSKIKLISPDKTNVHEVIYQEEDVPEEGWSVLF